MSTKIYKNSSKEDGGGSAEQRWVRRRLVCGLFSTHLERQSVRQVSQVISCYERVETRPGHIEQMCCGTESPFGQSTYGVWFRDIFPPADAPHKTSASEM